MSGKKVLRIVITDSGLGGLSVHALVDRKLRSLNMGFEIELIYFNAIADRNKGFNAVKDQKEKIKLFDAALTGIENFDPDIILIACNTLSVIYPYTDFSKNTSIQVFGIVESGINLITYYHNKYNASHIILLGTETTISSGIHKKRLIEAGIDPHVIIPQECRLLESEIQIDSDSQIVENMINGFIEEAESKIDTEIKCLFTVLCCTHYFFSKHVFKRILTKKFNSLFILLDPNEQMAESVIYELEQLKTNEDKFGSCKIKNEVYSKVRLYDKEILLLGNQLKAFSPHLQDALKNYIYKEDLIDI